MSRSVEPVDLRLGVLIARAEAGEWEPERAIDWSRRPVRPRLIPPRLYRTLVSQLYHGERATLAMCQRLMRELPDADARRSSPAKLSRSRATPGCTRAISRVSAELRRSITR